jgi:broad specificity phosphatase PhoE
MSELYLIRHGQASFHADNYDQLNDTGHAQARTLAQYWQSLGQRFDAVYSGNMRRQRETAQALLPLSAAPTVNILDGFDEYSSGELLKLYRHRFAAEDGLDPAADLKDLRHFQRVLEGACARWVTAELASAGIEPFAAFKQRVRVALDTVMAAHPDGQHVAIASSGGAIAMAVQSVLGLSDTQGVNLHWVLFNSSITRIRYSGTRRSLTAFNAVPHLERPGYTQMLTYR